MNKPNRFRFRAWDKERKEMVEQDESMAVSFSGRLCEGYTDGHMSQIAFAQDQFILMQSTGLVDSQGKEIFEGDVLVWWETDYECDRSPAPKYKFMGVVRWLQKECRFCLNYCGKYAKRPFSDRDYMFPRGSGQRVSGNIYENPDLLK